MNRWKTPEEENPGNIPPHAPLNGSLLFLFSFLHFTPMPWQTENLQHTGFVLSKTGTTGCCYLLQPHLSAATVIRQVFLYIRIMSGVTAILSPEPCLPTQAIVQIKKTVRVWEKYIVTPFQTLHCAGFLISVSLWKATPSRKPPLTAEQVWATWVIAVMIDR